MKKERVANCARTAERPRTKGERRKHRSWQCGLTEGLSQSGEDLENRCWSGEESEHMSQGPQQGGGWHVTAAPGRSWEAEE